MLSLQIKLRAYKLFACTVVAFLSLLLFACGSKDKNKVDQTEPVDNSISATPSKTYQPLPTQPTQAPPPEVEVTQVVARYFPDLSGFPTLYAAIEYKNTGSVAAFVSKVSLQFNTGAYLLDSSFTPMLYQDDIVYPGQTATLALWQTYSKEEATLTADSPIKATATLEIEPYDTERIYRRLAINNVMLIDNYPQFSTVSGSIVNTSDENDYALSLIYLSFYDESDQLLGVWHFTKNLALPANETRNFVMHLKSLPIPGLSAKTTRIAARGIGID